MGRRIAAPWTRDRRNRRYWYLTVRGKQILLASCDLGGDIDAAESLSKRKYHHIMGTDRPRPTDLDEIPTLAELVGVFLDWSDACVDKSTAYNYWRYCRAFCDHMRGDPLACDVRPQHVEQWVASRAVVIGTRRYTTRDRFPLTTAIPRRNLPTKGGKQWRTRNQQRPEL